jgi:hypothetical protein
LALALDSTYLRFILSQFPPDPAVKDKVVDGVKVTWKLPEESKKKKNSKKIRTRLAVLLRPLTPLLPPVSKETESTDGDSIEIIPPTFTCVTFPVNNAEPFLIPFAWAYYLTHNLSMGEMVMAKSNAEKGKVQCFETIGDKYGSFRLDDKMELVQNVITQLKQGSDVTREAIEDALAGCSHASRSNVATLPLPDACLVIDVLTHFMKERALTPSDGSATGKVYLMDLIRSTLPLSNGIGVIRSNLNRKKQCFSRWNLSIDKARNKSEKVEEPLSASAQEGLPHKIDDTLRVKLECAIEDFLKNNPESEIFIPLVTEEVAPSYYCAVPIGMSFQRVLRRLRAVKSPAGGLRCYYCSVESVLSDIQAIADNCVLYNSAESEVVKIALKLIPSAKRLLSDVSTHHIRESNARLKAEDERRRFVMDNCDSSALDHPPDEKSPSAKRRKTSNFPANLNVPFTAPLDGQWLQSIRPDRSWEGGPDSVSLLDTGTLQWIPQSGDSILYSRSLHSQFVIGTTTMYKGHYHSLATEQCLLPRFQRTGTDDSKDSHQEDESADDLEAGPNVSSCELSDAVQKNWLSGTVVWVRASFPRIPNKKDGEDSFQSLSPLLLMGLRFHYDWAKGEVHVVNWRPCVFPNEDDDSKKPSVTETSACSSCGVSRATSFLRPAWIPIGGCDKILGTQSQPIESPVGVTGKAALSIVRCFDLLKRRSLDEIPADFVDPRYCNMEKAKEGLAPATARVGVKSLPSFEELLGAESRGTAGVKTVTTRGIKKPDDAPSVERLAEVHFLPPWCDPAAQTRASQKLASHEALMPSPCLCLELIQLRLKHGYYRQTAALQNDLIEAYATSVLFVLSEPASRKRSPLSIRKITRYLSSAKGNSGISSYPLLFAKKPRKKAKKPDAIIIANEPEAPMKKTKKSADDSAKEPDDEAKDDDTREKTSSASLNEEETSLVSRIDRIRRLYATVSKTDAHSTQSYFVFPCSSQCVFVVQALVCVSETSQAERIFGLATRARPMEVAIPAQMDDPAQLAMVQKVRLLLCAVGRDARLKRCSTISHVTLKFTCGGETVQGEKLVPTPFVHVSSNPQMKLEDSILFGWTECRGNDALTRCLYGRPGRMYPCARCQVGPKCVSYVSLVRTQEDDSSASSSSISLVW